MNLGVKYNDSFERSNPDYINLTIRTFVKRWIGSGVIVAISGVGLADLGAIRALGGADKDVRAVESSKSGVP